VSETRLVHEIRAALSNRLVRLFRNNVGRLLLPDGLWLNYGLFPGSADLIGWRTVAITPEMVGKQIAQFVSVEVKTETGRVQPNQRQWAAAVTQAGGVAGVVHSLDEASQLLSS
jgi:hypothetical protein